MCRSNFGHVSDIKIRSRQVVQDIKRVQTRHRGLGFGRATATISLVVVIAVWTWPFGARVGSAEQVQLPSCRQSPTIPMNVRMVGISEETSDLVLVHGNESASVKFANDDENSEFRSEANFDTFLKVASTDEPSLLIVRSVDEEKQAREFLDESGVDGNAAGFEIKEAVEIDAMLASFRTIENARILQPNANQPSAVSVCIQGPPGEIEGAFTMLDRSRGEVASVAPARWDVVATPWILKFTPSGSTPTLRLEIRSPASVDTPPDESTVSQSPPTLAAVPTTSGLSTATSGPLTKVGATVDASETITDPGTGASEQIVSPAQDSRSDGVPIWLGSMLVGAVSAGLGALLGFALGRRTRPESRRLVAESPFGSEPDLSDSCQILTVDPLPTLDVGSASTVVQFGPTSVPNQRAAASTIPLQTGGLVGAAPLASWLHAEWGWSEKIKGKGEDALPIVMSGNGNESFIAVADGLGGAGAAEVGSRPDGQPITSAQVGSEAVIEAIAGFASRRVSISDMTPARITTAIRAKFDEKRSVYHQASFGGSLIREFPTTFASAALLRSDGGGIFVRAIWAGDSRVFVIYPDVGMSVLTRDHVDSDADDYDLMYVDPKMNNVVEAGADFYLEQVDHVITKPCYVLAATDGIFGYLPTPRFLEYLVLVSRYGAFPNGVKVDPPNSGMIRTVQEYTKDDASYALLAIGMRGMAFERNLILPRIKYLHQELFVSGRYAERKDGDPEFNRQNWLEFKDTYERLIQIGRSV